MSSAEAAQRRTDFARAYEQLSAARLACERARQRYDVCMHRYGAALGLHREANQQLSILKERFVEVSFQWYGIVDRNIVRDLLVHSAGEVIFKVVFD